MHIYDGKGWQNALVKKFNINGIPMNYLLDPLGKIAAKDLFRKQFDTAVAAVLKGEKVPEPKQASE